MINVLCDSNFYWFLFQKEKKLQSEVKAFLVLKYSLKFV